MGAHAEAFAARGSIESERVANRRVRTIRGDDQRSALCLTLDDETEDTAVLEQRRAHARARMHRNAWSGRSGFEERTVQTAAPLAIACRGHVGQARKAG